MTPELPDPEIVLAQFNLLIEELLSRSLCRSVFRPWEIEILVDIVSCEMDPLYQSERIIRNYQKEVGRQMGEGARIPLRLSEYLKALSRDPRDVKGATAG